MLLRQFSRPTILILAGAACLSFLLDSPTDGVIILLLVLISGRLGFRQEVGAASAVRQRLQALEVRTRGTLLNRSPSRPLVLATVAVVIVVVMIATLLLPSTPLGALLGFVPLLPFFPLWLLLIPVAYVVSAELVKGWFYRHHFEQD